VNVQGIAKDISLINENLPDYARIKKIVLANTPFSTSNQLLTDNGRLRRDAIISAFSTSITNIYSDEPHADDAGVVYDIL